jgi:ABC-2 type transport system ATP-binding protein
MSHVLEVKNVKKTISGKPIVKGLNMTIGQGEVYGFIGPNGAGKTTTIRMLVGLIRPSEGEILINGHNVQKDRSNALAHVGAIVENPELYGDMSGRKNLLHYARLARVPRKEIDTRISEVAKLVELEKRMDDKVKTYSLGMRQRLGIAQALIGNPSLLILDEPTNGLDPNGIRDFRHLIKKIVGTGISVFISSHLLSEIEMICDRVAILKEGSVILEKNVTDLLETEQKYDVKVDDVNLALHVLKETSFATERIDSKTIRISMEEEHVPSVVELFVHNSVKVYGITAEKETLEAKFLNIVENLQEVNEVG